MEDLQTSFEYVRVTGRGHTPQELVDKAREILERATQDQKDVMDTVFQDDDYESKLRYLSTCSVGG